MDQDGRMAQHSTSSILWSSSFTFRPHSLPKPNSLQLSHELSPSRLEDGGVPAGLTAEQIDHHLVGAHHDGRVGDLPDEVGGEAAVQRPVPLLSGYCQ